jgi:hypothetical protein
MKDEGENLRIDCGVRARANYGDAVLLRHGRHAARGDEPVEKKPEYFWSEHARIRITQPGYFSRKRWMGGAKKTVVHTICPHRTVRH